MTSTFLDASALLAFLFAEPGADVVGGRLQHATMSAVNYAETLTRSLERGKPLDEATIEITRLQLTIVSFDTYQPVVSASLRAATRARGLSFADRACLALALSRNLPAFTTDRVWGELDIGVSITCIR